MLNRKDTASPFPGEILFMLLEVRNRDVALLKVSR